MQRKQWSELTRRQRTAILVLAGVEVVLTATASVDLVRRPSAQVRGPKAAWAAGLLVQPVGPIAYLTVGRRCAPARSLLPPAVSRDVAG